MDHVVRDSTDAGAAVPPVGFLWWIVPFAAAMTLVELWEHDVRGALFNGAIGAFLALQIASGGRPRGWARLGHWILIGLLAVLTMVRLSPLIA